MEVPSSMLEQKWFIKWHKAVKKHKNSSPKEKKKALELQNTTVVKIGLVSNVPTYADNFVDLHISLINSQYVK